MNTKSVTGIWITKYPIGDSDVQIEKLDFMDPNKFLHELVVSGKSKMNSEGMYKYTKDSLYTMLDNNDTAKFKILKLSSDTLRLLSDKSKKELIFYRE